MLPWAQPELKVTVCGVVTGVPPLETITCTLVVPNAERGLIPKAGLEMVRAAAAGLPTEKLVEPLAVVVTPDDVTGLVAVMEAAPAAVLLKALKVMLAVPLMSVKRVLAGVIVAKVGSVTKVTTTP